MEAMRYERFSDSRPSTFCSRIGSSLSTLYEYTIRACGGNCRYAYVHDVKSKLNDGEIELLKMTSKDEWASGNGTVPTRQMEIIDNSKTEAESEMKKRVQYHFQSHFKKWSDTDRRRFPWMIILHLLLVVLVTTQISMYTVDKFRVTSFVISNTKAFENYFILSEHGESVGIMYSINDIYDQIEYIVTRYYNISEQFVTLSTYCRHTCAPEPLNMLVEYKDIETVDCEHNCHFNASIFPYKQTWAYLCRRLFPVSDGIDTCNDMCNDTCNDTCMCNGTRNDMCNDTRNDDTLSDTCNDTCSCCCTMGNCNHIVHDQVRHFVNIDNIYRIKWIKFDIKLSTNYQRSVIENFNAIESNFTVVVALIPELFSSRVHVDITLHPNLKRCFDKDDKLNRFLHRTFFDVIVIIILLLASGPYALSIMKTIRLVKDVKFHFLVYHRRRLRWQEINDLYNKWFILMLFTFLSLVVTIILKIISEYKVEIPLQLYEAVSILFAIEVFLLWCGMFGFLQYIESLNVLLITLKLGVPSFLRFSVCMLILFMAFVFCGWLVMGPYNPQFKDPVTAMESLIGILNGDGISDAFSVISTDNAAVLVFSKIYIILFVFIFIYVILSLFIGIFNHAYESLSHQWKERSRGYLRDWAEVEQSGDLTDNYPFPVPRIRDFSNEPTKNSDLVLDSNLALSKAPMTTTTHFDQLSINENYVSTLTADHQNEPTAKESITSPTADSLISQVSTTATAEPVSLPTAIIKGDHFNSNDSESHKKVHSFPRYYQSAIKRAPPRQESYGNVKSIVQEPPKASEEEVYKAQIKLLNSGFHQ